MANVRSRGLWFAELTTGGQVVLATVPAGERWLIKSFQIYSQTPTPNTPHYVGFRGGRFHPVFSPIYAFEMSLGDTVERFPGIVLEAGEQVVGQVTPAVTQRSQYLGSGIRFVI